MESQIQDYKTKIEAFHEYLPVIGFKTPLRVRIRIEDVYVPLRAMIDLRATGDSCFADSEDAEKCLKERGEGREISVPDAFKEAHRLNRRGIVILGDPGSGKTTHLKRLLIWCLCGGLAKLGLPDDTIPVFLSLRELKNLDIGIDTFIQTQLDQPHLKMPAGFGERLLARGNLLLLFDGLDEVAEPEQRVQVSKWIEDAEKVHRSCRFVVTSRFAGYTPEVRLGGAFIEMHMRPLSEKQAEKFIHNWYRSVETGIASDAELPSEVAKKQADEIIRRLKQPEFRARRILAMTRNPLLLTNLCLVHRDRGYLPRNRARLYEECIEVLLELWRGAIGFKGRVTADTGRKILQPVALWLHGKEERTRATAEELKPVIEPALKSVGWRHGSAAGFLKIVRDDSGLLTGWDSESYGFMHLGFQEYLAAREIRRSYFEDKGVIQRLADQFGKGWWQEVILLMLALREEPSLFTPFMREVVQRPAFTGHSELVEMCLDDALETSPEPFEELIRADPQKNRDLWERQLYALRILERLDEDAVKAVLESIKNHPSDEIRQWVQERLKQEAQEVIYSDPGGYELVWIPGGKFMMGSTKPEEGHYDDEEPVHEVHVPGFFMGRYPVTNEEYAR
ncbi:MAG: NACHT domain-containing protein, partial [Desulfococcaceae bacterium]